MCGHFVGLKFTPRCRSRPPSGPNTRVAARHPCHNAYVRVYCLLRGAKKISRQTECERFLSLKHLAPPRTPSLPLPRTRSAAHCVACRLSRQLWILMWWCECVHARGCTFNCCVYDKYLFGRNLDTFSHTYLPAFALLFECTLDAMDDAGKSMKICCGRRYSCARANMCRCVIVRTTKYLFVVAGCVCFF